MGKTNILIISGKQGSGKTSLQKSIIETWWKKFKIGGSEINFADPIYLMHNRVLEVLHDDCKWPRRELKKDGPLLQLLGTEWGRKIDTDIWVKIAQKKIDRMTELSGDKDGLVVIGDCRFENEFDAFPQALRVRLECSEEVRKARCSMWRDNTQHPSEIGLDSYARIGAFDLYIDTDKIDLAGATSLVSVALDKESWMERRRP